MPPMAPKDWRASGPDPDDPGDPDDLDDLDEPGEPADPDEPDDHDRIREEIQGAHRLLRRAARVLDRTASEEGWPVPFSPVRFLVLAHVREGTAFGVRPRRLARILGMKRSSLAHHLDGLEEAGLIRRRRRQTAYDRRGVAVRLTERGLFAFWRLGSALRADGRFRARLGTRRLEP